MGQVKYMEQVRASFPHLGSYHVPMEVLFTAGLGIDYIVPPPITKKTLEIGSRYSPDYVCAPFKYNLGNFIEAVEAGANTLVQTGGVCRLQYFGELHQQILQDLGYKVKFVNMAKAQDKKPIAFYRQLREINPGISLKKFAKILPVVMKMVEYIDQAEDYIRRNVGFENSPGEFDEVYSDFLRELRRVRNQKELDQTYRNFMRLFKDIQVSIPTNPLKVGIIGEFYTIMEPFSNHFLEKQLAKRGVVVDRWLTVSATLLHYPKKQITEHIKDYAKYSMGATSSPTIHRALALAENGFDGIIHVKSFGCTPETDVIPVLRNISKDYGIPVLYLSFDTQTSETGLITRLEAFCDMLLMRKEQQNPPYPQIR